MRCGTRPERGLGERLFALAAACAAALPLHAQDGSIPVEPLRDKATAAEAVVLDPVVVTGTRTEHRLSDAPVDVQLITARDIRNSGARDLAELLEREGGVTVTRQAARGTRIEIQGLSSEHVLILVDGRRMIGLVNGAIDLTRLRIADVERVEIVKGPVSALYGADALGGVVNVITRKGGSGLGGVVTVRGDTDANGEAWARGGFTLGTLDGQASAGYQHGEAYDLDDTTLSEDGPDGDGGYASAQADWALGDGVGIGLHGAYSLDDLRRLDPGIGSAITDTHKRIEEVRAGIAPYTRLGNRTELRFDLYYHRYFDQLLQTNAASGEVGLDEETLDELFVAGAQLDHRLDRHLLSFGIETQLERLQADRLADDAERDRQAVFVQDQFDLLDTRLQIVPGVRYDRDSQFGDQVSPKLALRYDLRQDLVLRAGVGRGYRAPDFKQLLLRFENSGVGYRVDGNPDLTPERSVGYNLGATWFANASSSIALSAYHHRVRDLIEIVQTDAGPPVVFGYRNLASARLTGVDLQAQWRPLPSWELRAGYGWLDAEDRDSGEPLSGRAEHRGHAALRFEPGTCALQLRGVWIGARRFGTEISTEGPPGASGTASPYALFDLRGEWRAHRRLQVALGVDNLFDEGDPDFLPIAPRSAYLELQWMMY
ncbi:TonB-dependent receptor plug domain-containing protein [Sinimarinibacterium flocculans]|uniref:TonB-dependent receptor plug domain-containing protein n=1 Tax=Sinimarinibacterium flocculans TaxID=985250 RepID=UPI003C78A2A1